MQRPVFVALLLFLSSTLVYFGTLTSAYAFDGVAYSGFVLLALQGRTFAKLFQANHLLHGPVAYLYSLTTGGAASEVAVHVRIQTMEAILGGATIALLYLLLRRFTARGVPLAAAVSVAVTYAFWHFSTDVEVYILAALMLVFHLDRTLTAFERQEPWPVALAGATAGLAALGQIAHCVFGAVSFVFLVYHARRHRWRTALIFAGSVVAVLLIAFTPLIVGPFAPIPEEERMTFLLGYAQPELVGKHLGAPWSRVGPNLAEAVHAVFAVPPPWLHPFVWLGIAGVATLAWVGWKRNDAVQRRVLLLASGWSLAQLLFFLMWDPNFKYWIAGMVPGAVILAFGLEELRVRLRPAWRPFALAALPVALLAWNLPQILEETDPARNRPLVISRAIRDGTPRDAVVLLSGLPPNVELKVYVPYFGERRTLVLDLYLSGADKQRRLRRLQEGIANGDQRYFALSELLDRPGVQRELERRHGLPEGAVGRALDGRRFRARGALPRSMMLYGLQR